MLHRFRTVLIVLCTLALAACGNGVVKRVSEPAASLQQLTVRADGNWTLTMVNNNANVATLHSGSVLEVEGIGRDPVTRVRMAVVPSGKPARTDVQRLLVGVWQGPQGLPRTYSAVRCTLHTGRTHQIRVHLAHVGHPLLGDETYGKGFRTKSGRLGDAARLVTLGVDLGERLVGGHDAVLQ